MSISISVAYVAEIERLRHDIERHIRIASELATENERLRAELERERMRLAACGVVAMANTPESAARARDIHPDYRSASCDDVARAVDSEMSLRAELAELRKPDCFRCAYWFACRTLIKDDCGGGDKFVPKRDPVRLYEIDAAIMCPHCYAMVGAPHEGWCQSQRIDAAMAGGG